MRPATKSSLLLTAVLMAASALPLASTAHGSGEALAPGEYRFGEGGQNASEGKRASCEVYAQLSAVQAGANRRYNCGYRGTRWDVSAETHFHWCRYVSRETVKQELKDRVTDLQQCFDRMGDFDGERDGLHAGQN